MVAACAWLVVSNCYVLVESLNELVVMARVVASVQHAPLRLAKRQLSRLKHEFQEHQDRQRLLQEISVLLNTNGYCTASSATLGAGLQGQDWLAFLDDSMQGQDFTKGAGRCLLYGHIKKTLLNTTVMP